MSNLERGNSYIIHIYGGYTMIKFAISLLVLFSVFIVPSFAQQSVEGKLGEWLTNGEIKLCIESAGEITNFADFNLEEASVVNAYTFDTFKKALAKGEVKVIAIEVKVQNVSNSNKQLGHRPKKAGKGEFYLESTTKFVPQDSGNRSEYFNNFSETGVIVSSRKLLEVVNGLYPENIVVAPGQEVSGKLLFVVPKEFAPDVICNLVNSNIVIGPFWVKLK